MYLVNEAEPVVYGTASLAGESVELKTLPTFAGFLRKDGQLELNVPTVGKGQLVPSDETGREATGYLVHFSRRIEVEEIAALLFLSRDMAPEAGEGWGQTADDYIVVPVTETEG